MGAIRYVKGINFVQWNKYINTYKKKSYVVVLLLVV